MAISLRARFLVVLSQLSAASLAAQQSAPDQSLGPPALYSVGLAFDDARQRLVLFGGYYRGAYSGDTWEWNGTQWARVSQSGPPGRNSPRMVYDTSRGKVVMFGGDTRAGAFGDTWEWDGRAWARIAGPGPTARSVHGMAYDSHRQRTVVFGGRDGAEFHRDTWELDRDGWRKVSDSGPPPRMLHAMAYDPSSRKVIVMSGSRAVAAPEAADLLGDAWSWDGTRWAPVMPGPGPRDHVAATTDPFRDGLLVIGGAHPTTGWTNEVWSVTNGSWSMTNTGAAGPRAGHAVATDARSRRVFLFGGFTTNGAARELWEYSAAGWKRVW